LNNGLKIYDSFIVKYDADNIDKGQNQTSLKVHFDNSHFTCSILLNNPSEFEGGGVKYDIDGLVYYSNKGDMILHSGYAKHCGLEITKGKRYVLIFFLKETSFINQNPHPSDYPIS
jgi:predicted 2-oxoglutarate/Fe(II)-dependent dioxygenase YbiX